MSSSGGAARCSAAGCFLVDLLPLQCPACHQPYCSAHFPAAASHDCIATGRLLAAPTGSDVKWIAQRRCALEGCNKTALEAAGRTANSEQEDVIGCRVRCEGCGLAFCATHRTRTSHHCATAEATRYEIDKAAAAERKRKAEETLATHGFRAQTLEKPVQRETEGGLRFEEKTGRSLPTFVPPSSSKNVEPPPPKLPQKPQVMDKRSQIALMKLRSKAVPLMPGASNVAGEDKVFFTWSWLDGDREGKGGEMWMPKTTTVGRMIDVMASKAGLVHRPDLSDHSKVDSSWQKLDSAETAASTIPQAATIRLARGTALD